MVKMRTFLVTILLLSVIKANIIPWNEIPGKSLTVKINQLWHEFLSTFKDVSLNSYIKFTENALAMLNQNILFANNTSTYEMEINAFAAMSDAEFAKRLGLCPTNLGKINLTTPRFFYRGTARSDALPSQIDWRKEGFVTEVKDQGNCGSCWAFSAVGALEGAWKRAHGELRSLSTQQLVDCSSNFGNQGCLGGLMHNAFEYIKYAGGIESENEYPYVSGITSAPRKQCFFQEDLAVANLSAIFDVPMKNENMLMDAVAHVGPVSIAINAGLRSFRMYKTGIYDEESCHGELENLNHGVLLVGYGIENNVPFWIVKNSWGKNWGEKGFIRIKRGNNICGVTTLPSYPIV